MYVQPVALKFLGHVISKKGFFPDDEHMSAIIDAHASHSLASLRPLLGLILWYSKFLPKFASVAEPLFALLRDAEFEWIDSANCSFKALKELIFRSLVLALFDSSLPIIISTDASDYGLGGVLTQMHSLLEPLQRPKGNTLRSRRKRWLVSGP